MIGFELVCEWFGGLGLEKSEMYSFVDAGEYELDEVYRLGSMRMLNLELKLKEVSNNRQI